MAGCLHPADEVGHSFATAPGRHGFLLHLAERSLGTHNQAERHVIHTWLELHTACTVRSCATLCQLLQLGMIALGRGQATTE